MKPKWKSTLITIHLKNAHAEWKYKLNELYGRKKKNWNEMPINFLFQT